MLNNAIFVTREHFSYIRQLLQIHTVVLVVLAVYVEEQSQSIVVGIMERFWAGIVESNRFLVAGKRLLIKA